jgi:cytochrome c551/c552
MIRLARLAVAGFVAGALGVGASVAAAQGSFQVDPNLASRGKVVYERNGCYACHGFGRVLAGPDLQGVTERRDTAWVRRWLKETNNMLESDPQARAMLEQWRYVRMPQIKLSDNDVNALLHFMAQETARTRALTQGAN